MRITLLAALLLGLPAFAGLASAQIDRPGQHLRYDTEIEPHLVVQWHEEPAWQDEGIGLGLRASIPLIDNGPVRTINNNFGISFGLDFAHFGDDWCGPNRNAPYDCSAIDFWLPVAAQWNFFFSDLISTMLELGLAIQHSRWDGPWWCDGRVCRDGSDTDVELVLWLGIRFHLSEDIALTLRLGTPSLLLGAAFFL